MEITINKIEKTYKTGKNNSIIRAIHNVNLQIPSNEIYGIIGKSGAGKSTLLRILSLLESPDSGSIFYENERVDNLSAKDIIIRRRKIGMIFQNFNLFSSRNAGQNIAYPLEICGYTKKEIDMRVDKMLEMVELSDRKNAPVSTLSGGQKQRIAIARALASKPDILFCDEATSALDPKTTKSILDLIRCIQTQMNLTVVMITHQMEVVRDACSLVAVIDNGEVVETGSVNDIFINPKSEITRDFLANISKCNENSAKKNITRWSKEGGEYTLRFSDSLTGEPILSKVSKKFDIEFNIRAGGIQNLPCSCIGTLVTDISGNEAEIEKAIKYMQKLGIIVEKYKNKEETIWK